jgi:catechol 2,3-dioxygenase-like lactoylglutathione lyase family enzyme
VTVATALAQSDVATRLPARDLDRARRWYSERLGLDPVEERPGGLRYRCGTTYFVVFQSTGKASGESTQMAWEVDDIEAVVADLKSRDVDFEEVDSPGTKTVNGIADIDGNYPSKARGERGAWLHRRSRRRRRGGRLSRVTRIGVHDGQGDGSRRRARPAQPRPRSPGSLSARLARVLRSRPARTRGSRCSSRARCRCGTRRRRDPGDGAP